MKLNHDCVRSILLELEENLTLNDGVTLYQLKDFETFKEYGYETSVYALTKLIEADFLNGSVSRADNKIDYIGVGSITWDGHQFLDNIRDNAVWSKTKDAVKSLSSVSLSILSNVGESITKKLIGLE
ncbi:DUF2513 domain-containing protein [Bacillus licheniformis]|uniref:DUF2513 domain-containing protein n=1 Tax=Bacillus subtilis group TaxID=653685 RepID=UPI000AAFC85A|nr:MULTISPECIES: DUF2513 domain-containing protein [Bacillus subtilis group]MBU8801099.1 DUF2513 domain-containing protein [Bacillus licheniformis]MED4335136.1 DUF2513 domain-containing protein [Bacillus licheniformis]TWK24451.1 hypothetical protein CHCC20373_3332 [Bacillus licheniformis]TWK44751.1 hypothetical protein CHCC20347_1471 [Bacillus paralicheniformis]GIN33487.1 DUF2513 domain-containing protein [Bacillus licheniformis]